MKKYTLTINDHGVLELRNLVRNTDKDLVMRALDRSIDASNVRSNSILDMTFKSKGGSKSWTQIVRFYPIFYGEITGEISRKDFQDVLQDADVGVYCDCPHFQYSGAAYYAAQDNYGVVNEARRPSHNRNSILCKHLYNAITVVDRNISNISNKYFEILLKQNRISEIKPEDVEELVEEDVIEPIDLPEDLDATPTEEYIYEEEDLEEEYLEEDLEEEYLEEVVEEEDIYEA